MAEREKLYKCDKCANIVEVKQAGDGELACCGEAMKMMTDAEASTFLTPPGMKPGAP